MIRTKVVDKMKLHILCSLTFFPPKICRLWDNVEQYGRPRQTTGEKIMRRMRFACWITKAPDVLWVCYTYCCSTATVVTRTHLNVTLYVHWQSVSKVTLYNVIQWGDCKMVDWKGFRRGRLGIIPVLSWNLSGRTEEGNETFRERTGIAVGSRRRLPPCTYEAGAFPLPQHIGHCYCNKCFSGSSFASFELHCIVSI
jgi:hypothetical protein